MSWGGGGVSPSPPQISVELSRHFLLANTPERWAGTHLPATIETNMAATANLERLPLRTAPGGLRRPLAPPPGGQRARALPQGRAPGGKAAGSAPGAARSRGCSSPSPSSSGGRRSSSPHSRSAAAARGVPVLSAVGRCVL